MIEKNKEVKVLKMGKFIEVKDSNIKHQEPKTQRIGKNNYYDKETGEVFEFSESAFSKDKKRTDNLQSLNNTRNKIKEIILSNYISKNHTMFITLLYSEYIADVKEFDKNFNSFMKQVRRKYPEQTINYVVSLEYHANGKLHAHLLLYWDKVYTSDDVENVCSYWKQGDCRHFPIRNNQDLLYICAYLTNSCAYVTDPREFRPDAISENAKIKQSVKNERLCGFGAYLRIFRHSKGMNMGEVKTEKYDEIYEDIAKAKKIYHGSIDKKIIEKNNLHIQQKYEYYFFDEDST